MFLILATALLAILDLSTKLTFFNGQDGLRFRIELTFKKQFQTTVANMETYHFN